MYFEVSHRPARLEEKITVLTGLTANLVTNLRVFLMMLDIFDVRTDLLFMVDYNTCNV